MMKEWYLGNWLYIDPDDIIENYLNLNIAIMRSSAGLLTLANFGGL